MILKPQKLIGTTLMKQNLDYLHMILNSHSYYTNLSKIIAEMLAGHIP